MPEQLPPSSFVRIDDTAVIGPRKTPINQFIDILRTDISNVSNRKNYDVFVSGSAQESQIKSGLFQTIFDQDFTLSTANPLFDISQGLYSEDIVENNITKPSVDGITYEYDASGKIVYSSSNGLMIREKVNLYRQFAKTLLGDANLSFITPHFENRNNQNVTEVTSALFLCFRRIFTRDNIVKGSFTFRISRNAAFLQNDEYVADTPESKGNQIDNIETLYTADTNLSENDLITISDSLYGQTNVSVSPVSGEVTTLTAEINGVQTNVGLIYYDKGVVVLDINTLFDINQTIRGKIDSTSTTAFPAKTGPWYLVSTVDGDVYSNMYTNENDAKQIDFDERSLDDIANAVAHSLTITVDNVDYELFQPGLGNPTIVTEADDIHPTGIPQFVFGGQNIFYSDANVVEDANGASVGVRLFEGSLKNFIHQATVDDVLNHFCLSRIGDEQNRSSIVFQNETVINSKIIECVASASQMNYSTNPTFINSNGEIVAKNAAGDTFTYITTVGLYDSTGTLVAVAKTSRPIEKNPLSSVGINVRLDF